MSKYAISDGFRFLSEELAVDARRILLRAGLPADFLAFPRALTGTEYFDLWIALEREVEGPFFALRLSRLVGEKGFDSAAYAFCASPDVRRGIDRATLLKSVISPVRMTVTDYAQHMAVSFGSAVPDRAVPPVLGWYDLISFVQTLRQATGEPVDPVAVEAAHPAGDWDAEGFFGCPVAEGSGYRLVLTRADAERVIIGRHANHAARVERGLDAWFDLSFPEASSAVRVRRALIDGLPGGLATADDVARRLAMSKRSLQRRLNDEGLTFKDVLEDTRRGLALSYLANTGMNAREIAYLLGFRDPSSFFRAFRSWTGRTPEAVRRAS